MSGQTSGKSGEAMRDALDDEMEAISERVRACMQCGTCTSSCASSQAMDATPRELWRMAQLGMKDDIFASKTFWLCSSCYNCTLRCPRGLPLTETIAALKRAAMREGRYRDKRSPMFYRAFMETVRRYGRVREMELMARYFLSLGNPIVPIGFTGLGARLLVKGKLSVKLPQEPSTGGKLDAIYKKVREMEGGS